ncbi:MAG: hypothetical protein GZ091_12670 [Paludibacter sp.]|nr:hypothetical protein [Paludibacter sp.]
MNRIPKHTTQFALLLLAVFISSSLIKPAHSLFAHHQHSEGICITESEHAITADHYKDCPVCDFEFCTFIPQKQISIPQATLIIRKEQTLRTVACLAQKSTHLFQLRAPPAL